MGFRVNSLWTAPEINPVNNKARSIPILNPVDRYGRVFFFSWFGFFIAFWSWYAFPPLLTVTIKDDLKLTQADIANSNILSLTATLIVRLTAGPACDRFGARWTFVVILLTGAIPTALAGAVTNVQGLFALRFFVGILGGSFIPCQVWTTAFFDKNVVGTANSLAAGFGNAGSGITYFAMPAILESLVLRQNLTHRVAWRVAFLVPFGLIVVTAICMLVLCPDTPTGRWSARHSVTDRQLAARDAFISTVGDSKGRSTGMRVHHASDDTLMSARAGAQQAQSQEQDLLNAASWELVEAPTVENTSRALLSWPTLFIVAAYFCTFGSELCINSILGAYYHFRFPSLGQTGSGNWAAMFGLLNAVFRPIGGMTSDLLYRYTRSLWAKKLLIHGLCAILGVFLLVIGFVDPDHRPTMFGLVVAMAFFLEAGNGACFSLVPHVHPSSNGVITGVTGASGNLGGIVFLLIARYDGVRYERLFWLVGAVCIAISIVLLPIRPIPKNQLGGR